jgi:hypothetical protein
MTAMTTALAGHLCPLHAQDRADLLTRDYLDRPPRAEQRFVTGRSPTCPKRATQDQSLKSSTIFERNGSPCPPRTTVLEPRRPASQASAMPRPPLHQGARRKKAAPNGQFGTQAAGQPGATQPDHIGGSACVLPGRARYSASTVDGITLRPAFDPAPVGLACWRPMGRWSRSLSRQHPAATRANYAGARLAA